MCDVVFVTILEFTWRSLRPWRPLLDALMYSCSWCVVLSSRCGPLSDLGMGHLGMCAISISDLGMHYHLGVLLYKV